MKIILLIPLFLGLGLTLEVRSYEPTPQQDVLFFAGMAAFLVAFLALARWQCSKHEKFMGMSFGGWTVGIFLSLIVGLISGLFLQT